MTSGRETSKRMTCGSPIDDARLVAYWANDLSADQLAEIEEHLFACDTCFAHAERTARIARAFQTQLPTVISAGDLAALHARGMSIRERVFVPGQREVVVFEPGTDLLVHRLGGLDLASAERVEVIVRSESGAGVIAEELFAPFDRDRGEVLIACQRHFAAFPRDIVFDVRVHRRSAPPEVATYIVPHEYL